MSDAYSAITNVGGTAGTTVCSSSPISRPRRPSDPNREPFVDVFSVATRQSLNNEHMKVHRLGHEHAFSIPRSMRSSSTRLARFDAVPDSHDHLSSHASYDVGDDQHSRVFTSRRALSSHVDRLDRLAVDARASESPKRITHASLHLPGAPSAPWTALSRREAGLSRRPARASPGLTPRILALGVVAEGRDARRLP